MNTKDIYKYQREWQKENYKRLSINIPKAWEIPIKARAKQLGKSTNEYIKNLIEKDITEYYTNLKSPTEKEQGAAPSTPIAGEHAPNA